MIHGGDYPNINCLFTRESSEYERLYSLDVLGVEDRGENDQFDVLGNSEKMLLDRKMEGIM